MRTEDPLFVSRSNQRALFIFLALALCIVFLPRIIGLFQSDTPYTITSEEYSDIIKSRNEYQKRTYSQAKKKRRVYKMPPKKFDPNMYTKSDWISLGLSEKQANVVVKFCSRGIYSNDQLRRIFSLPEELFILIKDSTVYPIRKEKSMELSERAEVRLTKRLILVNVNKATQADLEEIPGVGSFYAKNILNYRNRLGGFVRKEQLLEVWKMEPQTYEAIERFIEVDARAIEQININTAVVEQLKQHPYLSWKIANSIVKMRQQKNQFKSLEELKESHLIDEELFEKLKPYLTL
jgi:competence protein ComEA